MLTRNLLLVAGIAHTACALNPAIKLAGKGMALLGPVFTLENKLQAAALGRIGGVDSEDVKQEIADDIKAPCVIYTYGLSPFSTEAVALLEAKGANFEVKELGSGQCTNHDSFRREAYSTAWWGGSRHWLICTQDRSGFSWDPKHPSSAPNSRR